LRLGFQPEEVRSRLRAARDHLLRSYSLSSGAFLHALGADGSVLDTRPDLYGQAFVLFGLAHAYGAEQDEAVKVRAKELLAYLQRERRLPEGGYSELGSEGILRESNPHMHLFEAALAWMSVDGDGAWRLLADELFTLCREKFIDPDTGLLVEHFGPGWRPLREGGRFVAEPGHHFEWCWLMEWYGRLTGKEVRACSGRLFALAERHGVSPQRGIIYDEVWSDFSPKKRSSRYWPHCERVKAALRLGEAAAADQALAQLFLFLDTPVPGLCYDHREADGTMAEQPPKSSFLYHVVNALDEYLSLRETL
jgi:mannose-6-phosphate isomerase